MSPIILCHFDDRDDRRSSFDDCIPESRRKRERSQHLWSSPSGQTPLLCGQGFGGVTVVVLPFDRRQVFEHGAEPGTDPTVSIETADQTVPGGTVLQLSATSRDSDSSTVGSYAWATDPVTTGTFSDPAVEDPTPTAPATTMDDQEVTLTLTVTENVRQVGGLGCRRLEWGRSLGRAPPPRGRPWHNPHRRSRTRNGRQRNGGIGRPQRSP